MDTKILKKILTPGQFIVAVAVYGAGKTVAEVARDLAPSRDYEKPDAMKRHEATVSKRLQRVRQRLAGYAIAPLDARRQLSTQPPTMTTFSDTGLYAR